MHPQQRLVHAPPDQVFAVLSDGWVYASWVVGAARIRAVSPTWPAQGSEIHHSVGLWPVMLSDSTQVLESEAPRHLRLKARAWPAGVATVDLRLEPHSGGTLVTMEEWATEGPATMVPRLVEGAGVRLRNREALRRLAFLAEKRGDAGD